MSPVSTSKKDDKDDEDKISEELADISKADLVLMTKEKTD